METDIALNESFELNTMYPILDHDAAISFDYPSPSLPLPILPALQIQIQQERIRGLIHDMSGSLTFLLNAVEMFRLSSGNEPPEQVLTRLQHEAERICLEIQSLEEVVLDTQGWPGQWEGQVSSTRSVLWAVERPPHQGLDKAIRGVLGKECFLRMASSLEAAMEELRCHPFDLLLTGHQLDGGTGFDLVRALWHEARWMPAVMVTRSGSEALAARCIEEGFLGYVCAKMLGNPGMVAHTLLRALHHGSSLRRFASSIRQVGEMAVTDGLTSLYNRFFIEQLLIMEVNRSQRYGHPFCVALVDVDGFKAINDRMGHRRGDLVLRELASLLKKNLRTTDHIGRYGGDEFLIILPQANLESGLRLCGRMVRAVAGHIFLDQGPDPGITLSVGLTHWEGDPGLTQARILEEADEALYKAKRGGKNRVCHSSKA